MERRREEDKAVLPPLLPQRRVRTAPAVASPGSPWQGRGAWVGPDTRCYRRTRLSSTVSFYMK